MQPRSLTLNKIPRIGSRIPDLSDKGSAPASRIKTELGTYDIEAFNGTNESGYHPIGDRVLVMPDQASKFGGIGVIQLPEDLLERIAIAAETGVIVAVGDDAFHWNSDRSRKFEGKKPEVGSRIFFERYAGGKLLGRDGRWYRCLDDKSIGCFSA